MLGRPPGPGQQLSTRQRRLTAQVAGALHRPRSRVRTLTKKERSGCRFVQLFMLLLRRDAALILVQELCSSACTLCGVPKRRASHECARQKGVGVGGVKRTEGPGCPVPETESTHTNPNVCVFAPGSQLAPAKRRERGREAGARLRSALGQEPTCQHDPPDKHKMKKHTVASSAPKGDREWPRARQRRSRLLPCAIRGRDIRRAQQHESSKPLQQSLDARVFMRMASTQAAKPPAHSNRNPGTQLCQGNSTRRAQQREAPAAACGSGGKRARERAARQRARDGTEDA